MSAQENKAFIGRYLRALSGQDKPPELLDQYIADSDQELKEHIAFFEAAFPRYELIADDMVAEGDKVAVRATFRGTHEGDLMGLPPTRKTATIPIMLIYRIADGKIAEHWMVADQMSLMQQLGAIPTPG
jgi:predicted ester cyclase